MGERWGLALAVLALAARAALAASAAPTVVLTAPAAPRVLLAGVAVPIPFSLLAAGIECDAGTSDCLLVEVVLSRAECAGEPPAAGAGNEVAQTPRCEHGDGVDVSRNHDCGVLRHTLAEGDGATPPPGARVTAHYVGTLENGVQFDSSRDRDEPFSFTLGKGQVIKCWDDAFATMSTGEHARITCSAPYAYGEHGIAGFDCLCARSHMYRRGTAHCADAYTHTYTHTPPLCGGAALRSARVWMNADENMLMPPTRFLQMSFPAVLPSSSTWSCSRGRVAPLPRPVTRRREGGGRGGKCAGGSWAGRALL